MTGENKNKIILKYSRNTTKLLQWFLHFCVLILPLFRKFNIIIYYSYFFALFSIYSLKFCRKGCLILHVHLFKFYSKLFFSSLAFFSSLFARFLFSLYFSIYSRFPDIMYPLSISFFSLRASLAFSIHHLVFFVCLFPFFGLYILSLSHTVYLQIYPVFLPGSKSVFLPPVF